jgi:cyclase
MKFPLLAVAATRVCVAAIFSVLSCSPAAAQRIDYSKLEIKTTDLGHGVYLLGWQGGDSLILVGDDGVLLVDTSVAQMGEKIKAAIARVSDKPIKLIVNTHAHADHFGANEALAKGGAIIVAQDNLRERMAKGQYLAAFNQTIPPSGSEDEAVPAKPTRDFDARWVHQGNFVTGDTMTRLAYQSLKGIRPRTTP